MIRWIPSVDAGDFPEDVMDYCVEREISTHYQNDITHVENNGNPLAEWLKQQGLDIPAKGISVAIFST